MTTAEIPLTRGLVAIVDADDLERLMPWRWSASPCARPAGNFYACRGPRGVEDGPGTVYMHRVVIGAKKGQVVDHINGNRLDNRRANLRFCSQSENSANSNKKCGVSGYRGVTESGKVNGKQWRARIRVDGRTRSLGYFSHAVDAARSYDNAAVNFFGEFAKLNFRHAAEPVAV